MPSEMPEDLNAVLKRARKLTFAEARQLSSQYDRGPGTSGATARKAADMAAKNAGLTWHGSTVPLWHVPSQS